MLLIWGSVLLCSITQSCPTLCGFMNCSTPGFPLYHQLPELTKTHDHRVMPSNHLILCHPLLLLPSVFSSIRVFSFESVLCIKWPKYWSFSFSISPSVNIQDWFPLGWTGWISLQFKRLSRVFSNTTVQKYEDRPIEKIIESRDRPTYTHSIDFQLRCQDNSIASVFLINDTGTTEYSYGNKPKVPHIQKLI